MIFFYQVHAGHLDLHSFPTRRSSDLTRAGEIGANVLTIVQPLPMLTERIARYRQARVEHGLDPEAGQVTVMVRSEEQRLNSSHGYISYAVFCLKKKKKKKKHRLKTKS